MSPRSTGDPGLSGSRLVDLLRHGEVEGGPRFRGACDDPLSAAGWAQLEAKAEAMIGAGPTPWDRVLSSPAQRCLAFAQALGNRLGLEVESVDALRERDFGAWEGLRADEIPAEALARFWCDPSGFDPPAAEPFWAFRARIADAWRGLVDGAGHHTLVLTHGGVIRVILAEVLGLADERLILLEVPPASGTRVRLPALASLGLAKPSLVAHGELGSGS